MTRRTLLVIPALLIATTVHARAAQEAHADIINAKGGTCLLRSSICQSAFVSF